MPLGKKGFIMHNDPEKRIKEMQRKTELAREELAKNNESLGIQYSTDKAFIEAIHKGPAIFVRDDYISKKVYHHPNYFDAFIEANRAAKALGDKHHIFFEGVDVNTIVEKIGLAIIHICMGS